MNTPVPFTWLGTRLHPGDLLIMNKNVFLSSVANKFCQNEGTKMRREQEIPMAKLGARNKDE